MKALNKSLIVGTVLASAALIGVIAAIAQGANLGVTLFIGFLAVIIAFQVAPALMLFGALVKEIVHPTPKEKAQARSGDVK